MLLRQGRRRLCIETRQGLGEQGLRNGAYALQGSDVAGDRGDRGLLDD
jgi:hypothetical protein